MLFAGDAIASNPHLYKGLSYDVFRDLAPVTLLARVPMTLVVPAGLPVRRQRSRLHPLRQPRRGDAVGVRIGLENAGRQEQVQLRG